MIEKTTLRIFWISMLVCAATVLTMVWMSPEPMELQFKIAASTFVIGFASFLIWAPMVVYRFYAKLSV